MLLDEKRRSETWHKNTAKYILAYQCFFPEKKSNENVIKINQESSQFYNNTIMLTDKNTQIPMSYSLQGDIGIDDCALSPGTLYSMQ